jgi:hypothetical protein
LRVALVAIDAGPTLGEASIQLLLCDVAEGRMAKVVREGGCLGDVGVEPNTSTSQLFTVLNTESLRRSTGDLCYLESVGKAVVEDVPFEGANYLRDTGQSPECRRVEDAVSILLTGGAGVSGFLLPYCGRVPPGVRRSRHPEDGIRRARLHDCRQ